MTKDVSADGLRGIAALSVVLCHFLISFSPAGFKYHYPSAAYPDATWSWLDSLISTPFISVMWNGTFAVCIFFVLSGYVLTKSFYVSGDLNVLRLRAIRRYFRLCVPIFGSVMLSYVLMSIAGKYWQGAGTLSRSLWLYHFWQITPEFFDALRNGVYGAIFGGISFYTPPLWTMRIEFVGSMLVFAYAAISLRGAKSVIFFVVVAAGLRLLFPSEWIFYLAFIAGSHVGRVGVSADKSILISAFVLGIIFGGFDFSAVYKWTSFIPLESQDRETLFCVIGGIFLVYSVRGGVFKWLWESQPAQFLGRISYSLYLVHFPILLTFSSWLYIKFASLAMSRFIALGIDLVASMAVFFLAAWMFDRTFDRGGIALSKKLFPGKTDLGISKASA